MKKTRVSELWFLCKKVLHSVFCQCMKFQVHSFSSFEYVARTKIQNEIIEG